MFKIEKIKQKHKIALVGVGIYCERQSLTAVGRFAIGTQCSGDPSLHQPHVETLGFSRGGRYCLGKFWNFFPRFFFTTSLVLHLILCQAL